MTQVLLQMLAGISSITTNDIAAQALTLKQTLEITLRQYPEAQQQLDAILNQSIQPVATQSALR